MTTPTWDIIELISRAGGQADIYKVAHRPTGQLYAAKFPKPMHVGDPDVMLRFRREAAHYERLHVYTPHPHVVRMFSLITWNGHQGIVLELMQGSFEARLRRWITDAERIRAIRQAALGLDHLHHHNIAHRDMKPSNLLQAYDGRYVVADLGCATAAGAMGINLTRQSIGTRSLMAPEQHGPHYFADARSDMYGLGTCIAAAFLDEFPEQGPTQNGNQIQVALTDKLERLDPAFQDLIWKCIHPDNAQRFRTMKQFISAWDALAHRRLLRSVRRPPKVMGLLKGLATVALIGLGTAAIAAAASGK